MANENVEQFVKQSMNQTENAMEQYFGFVQNALATFPMTSPELTEKMKNYTAKNLAASRRIRRTIKSG